MDFDPTKVSQIIMTYYPLGTGKAQVELSYKELATDRQTQTWRRLSFAESPEAFVATLQNFIADVEPKR